MPYMISSRSVIDGVSLSVIMAKLVYKSMIFVDNKLTLISVLVGGVAQWQNVGLWPANFPCPALDLQLMGDH